MTLLRKERYLYLQEQTLIHKTAEAAVDSLFSFHTQDPLKGEIDWKKQ